MFRPQFGHHQALNEHISSNQTHWIQYGSSTYEDTNIARTNKSRLSSFNQHRTPRLRTIYQINIIKLNDIFYEKHKFNLQTHSKEHIMFLSWGSPVVNHST
jgi:hypothetical protein